MINIIKLIVPNKDVYLKLSKQCLNRHQSIEQLSLTPVPDI